MSLRNLRCAVPDQSTSTSLQSVKGQLSNEHENKFR